MYYSIENAHTSKTGNHPQLQLKSDTYKKNPSPDFKKIAHDQIADSNLDLNCFEFSPNAIATDILSSDVLTKNYGLFINNKAFQIINNLSNPNIKFHPLRIGGYDYHFMQIIDVSNIIDFTQSLFIDILAPDKGTFSIKSYNEYLETNKSRTQFYEPTKIVLQEDHDIFRTPFDISIIINETLKTELEEKHISGVDIQPYSNIEIL